MSIKESIVSKVNSKIAEFCSANNMPLVNNDITTGVTFRVVVKDSGSNGGKKGRFMGATVILQMVTKKTQQIAAVFSNAGEELSSSGYDTEFPKLVSISLDQIFPTISNEFAKFYQKNQNNEDLTVPISFHIESVDIDSSVVDSTGSSGLKTELTVSVVMEGFPEASG